MSERPARSIAESRFQLGVGLYVFALCLFGFARNFYLRPFGSQPLADAGPIYTGTIVHGVLFTGWMVLAVWQPWQVMQGRTESHRKSGQWGGVLAVLLVFSGIHVALVQASRFAAEGGPVGFVAIPLGIMVFFAIAFGIALANRTRPSRHKRWIVIAHCVILEPAAARALSTADLPVFPFILLLIALPLLAGIIFDIVSQRRTPWTYLVGMVFVLGGGFLRHGLANDPAWSALAQRVFG